MGFYEMLVLLLQKSNSQFMRIYTIIFLKVMDKKKPSIYSKKFILKYTRKSFLFSLGLSAITTAIVNLIVMIKGIWSIELLSVSILISFAFIFVITLNASISLDKFFRSTSSKFSYYIPVLLSAGSQVPILFLLLGLSLIFAHPSGNNFGLVFLKMLAIGCPVYFVFLCVVATIELFIIKRHILHNLKNLYVMKQKTMIDNTANKKMTLLI